MCRYRSVSYKSRIFYVNGLWQEWFSSSSKVSENVPFVDVQCKDTNDKIVSSMLHYPTKQELRKREVPHNNNFSSEQMNVLLLGLDSLSGNLFKRAMKKTRDYLLNTMGVVEMNMYNKVGDNTFSNLIAIAAGNYERYIPSFKKFEAFDYINFIWQDFKKAGFRTQYVSDMPDFDDFSQPPTDSYNIPMVKSLMKDKNIYYNNCFEDQIEVTLWLNLVKEFILESIHTTGRFFSLAVIDRPTHDFPNKASAVDELYFNFLKDLHQSSVFNNTFFVFFGDHGPRWGAYRKTFEGSIEERAPAMLVYTPEWFQKKHSRLFKNLLTNANRLTTNFDIHKTLKCVLTLDFEGLTDKSKVDLDFRTRSLFSEISPTRTCKDADLSPHFCMCNDGVPVPTWEIAPEIGNQVVQDINSITSKYRDKCAVLKFRNVTSLTFHGGSIGWSGAYRIMFDTSPGLASFEATVRYTVSFFIFTSVQTLGDISRTSTYKNLSDCVEHDKIVRMYCYYIYYKTENIAIEPSRRFRRLLNIRLILPLILITVAVWSIQRSYSYIKLTEAPQIKYGDSCRFPELDPFSPNSLRYYEQFPTVECPDGLHTLTYYDGKYVHVNQTLKRNFHKDESITCRYRSVFHKRRIYYVNGEWQDWFSDVSKVSKNVPFVDVQCKDTNDKIVSSMLHYPTKQELRKREVPHNNNFSSEQMNVLLLGLDSLSGNLFKRAMKKTRDYLLNTMGVVEMNMYNKVGDNTFPNLLAIAAGKYEHDIPNWSQAEGFDAVNFIWQDFKKAGFRTQYVSDMPDFDDFSWPPTDSYNIPMLKSLLKDKNVFDNNCFEDQIEVKVWLNLVKEFILESLHTTGRFFSLAVIDRPTHDFPNKASAVDELYFNFLRDLHQSSVFNNTFFVFFGDHGPRVGAYRKTFEGSIEERTPAMLVYTPEWFQKKHSRLFKNLLTNANRLTTNFDIHKTLKCVLSLDFEGLTEKSKVDFDFRVKSFFSEISIKRTCEDADLSPHYCMCNGGVPVPTWEIAPKIGYQVVQDINSITSKYRDKCAVLKFRNVTSLTLHGGSIGWSGIYRIMFDTSPGLASFEATVRYTVSFFIFTSVQTLGDISRTSTYKNLSDCVEHDKIVRMYCYCKDLLTS
ncbi:uncharacterized protein LOC131951075 [Physella acuta]|uniref:uncharacterized protein LOC131951075 n=1 Tax=Physella acuta TaxID=109671 RepID=UPI0027DAF857|nr:uncharacterized protein LOC131951075 [Physella acuta]